MRPLLGTLSIHAHVTPPALSDQDTGVSKGFGFVSFSTCDEADAAMASMNGAMIGGRSGRPCTNKAPFCHNACRWWISF